MKMRLLAPFAIALAILPSAAQAQADDPRLLRAQAAGYKAQFLCSGLWNAGKSVAQIEADELTGIYAEIAAIVPTLKAEIEPDAKQVWVAFAQDMPPRVAIHNPVTGCTGMPIGWRENWSGKSARPLHPVTNMKRLAPGSLDAQPWPMGNASPKQARLPTALGQVIDQAFAPGSPGKTSGVLIVKDGQIIAERYKPGHTASTSVRTWSVAKSIAATYAGFVKLKIGNQWNALNGQGDDAVDPRRKISIDHLLRMSSGLISDTAGNRTDAVYVGGGAIDEWSTKWPLLHLPGTKFRYANYDTLSATLMVRAMSRETHPHMLFDAIGMTRTFAETDWKGHYMLSSQVWTTARDLARLGTLYLNDGKWNGAQILPADWRSYVTAPSGPQPDGPFGYGASFWLMNKTDGVPKDSFAAFGNRGQFLVIIPSLNMLIVRQGYDTDQSRFDIAAFTKAVVAAVPGKK